VNAKAKANHIQVRQDGAEGAGDPEPFGHAGAVGAGSKAQCRDGVGEGGCQGGTSEWTQATEEVT
jgi:hypothetical protein